MCEIIGRELVWHDIDDHTGKTQSEDSDGDDQEGKVVPQRHRENPGQREFDQKQST